jgi:hypothetical protein
MKFFVLPFSNFFFFKTVKTLQLIFFAPSLVYAYQPSYKEYYLIYLYVVPTVQHNLLCSLQTQYSYLFLMQGVWRWAIYFYLLTYNNIPNIICICKSSVLLFNLNKVPIADHIFLPFKEIVGPNACLSSFKSPLDSIPTLNKSLLNTL